MKAHKSGGINLFLLELIIVLLFFSISIAVVLNMFSVANSKASQSKMNEKMILCSQSVSELFADSGNMEYVTAKLFGGITKNGQDSTKIVYMDKDLNPVIDIEDAIVTLKLKETKDMRAGGVYATLDYEFAEEGGMTFSGSSAAYIPDFEVNGNEQ